MHFLIKMKIPTANSIIEALTCTTHKSRASFLLEDIEQFTTERQFRIIKFKLQGFKNIEIAERLRVCPATITCDFYRIRNNLKFYFNIKENGKTKKRARKKKT